MSVVVQDNFLDKEYFKKIQTEIILTPREGREFPWFRSGIDYTGVPGEYQMSHVVYGHHTIFSNLFDELKPLFKSLGVYSLQRVKINLQERKEKIIEHDMHIDVPNAPENALTSILYMNTNNGYTKFETGEKVESVENRIVTFPNNLRHTGTTNNCEAPYRCVMNIDWIKVKI